MKKMESNIENKAKAVSPPSDSPLASSEESVTTLSSSSSSVSSIASPASSAAQMQPQGSKRHVTQEKMVPKQVSNLASKVRQFWNETGGLRVCKNKSDVLVRTADGNQLFSSVFVLSQWSDDILAHIEKPAVQDDQPCEWLLKVNDFQWTVVSNAFNFMYGGSMMDLDPQLLAEVAAFADKYQMSDLKKACLETAQQIPLSLDNVFRLWSFSEQFQQKRNQDRIQRFFYSNLSEIVREKEIQWMALMEKPNFLLDFFDACLDFTKPKNADSKTKDVACAFVQTKKRGSLDADFSSIWKKSNGLTRPTGFSDVTILTKDGRRFYAHTIFVHSTAPSLANFLHEECETGDIREVLIDDIDGEIMDEVLRAVYRQQPTEKLAHMADLVYVAAIEYGITTVAERCEHISAAQAMTSVESAVCFLDEAEEHRMETGKKVIFRYLYEHGRQLKDLSQWRELVAQEPSLLIEMLLESHGFFHVVGC